MLLLGKKFLGFVFEAARYLLCGVERLVDVDYSHICALNEHFRKMLRRIVRGGLDGYAYFAHCFCRRRDRLSFEMKDLHLPTDRVVLFFIFRKLVTKLCSERSIMHGGEYLPYRRRPHFGILQNSGQKFFFVSHFNTSANPISILSENV